MTKDVTRCRDCKELIMWVTLVDGTKTRRIPLDYDADVDGDYHLQPLAYPGDHTYRAFKILPGAHPPADERRTCHLDTCTERQHVAR